MPLVTAFDDLPWISGFYYLGSPYSKYPDGIQSAFIDVCRIAGRFVAAGISVYSPIAHTHAIARIAQIDPYDHEIWLPFDEPMMSAAGGMIVAMMPSWDTSYGIDKEVEFFLRENKPIYYMEF